MPRHLRALLPSRRWLRFSLRGLFIVITLFGIWLGVQVNWLRKRQEARRWIQQHESPGQWSQVNPTDVTWTKTDGTKYRGKPADAPWSLRLLGESRLALIHLNKSTLCEADIPRINSLLALFPEAEHSGVHIDEPGLVYRWPPPDPQAFLKYPSRIVGGKIANQPDDALGSDPN
jgi:hypothetical protein